MFELMLVLGGAALGVGGVMLSSPLRAGLLAAMHVRTELEEADMVRYCYRVNGMVRFEEVLPPASERDAGPFVVYYGYRSDL